MNISDAQFVKVARYIIIISRSYIKYIYYITIIII